MRKPIHQTLAAHAVGLALSVCLLAVSLHAETQAPETKAPKVEKTASPVAIGAAVGTSGYGPFVVLTASKNITATIGYTFLDYDYDTSSDSADYTGKLKLSNLQAILNWHPWAGTFHLSAGAFLSNNKVTVIAKPKPNATYTIDNTTYTAAQVGTLSGEVELAKNAAPYIGFGWAKKPLKGGFGVFFDVGVVFRSAPTASLSATGPIANDATFKSKLRIEENDLNKDLKPLRYYPVIQFGLLYRF